jgi:hypothetical protein
MSLLQKQLTFTKGDVSMNAQETLKALYDNLERFNKEMEEDKKRSLILNRAKKVIVLMGFMHMVNMFD